MTTKLIEQFIIKPLKKIDIKEYLVLLMSLGGLFLILIGTLFEENIQVFLPMGSGDVMQKIGGAVLGGGAFAAIMKGALFRGFFIETLSQVFYNPNVVLSPATMLERWKVLTAGILKNTLPETYRNATDVIAAQFLQGGELLYHFEGLEVRYEFTLIGDDLTVCQTTVARIIISPNQSEVMMTQSVLVDGQLRITDLLINGSPVSVEIGMLTEIDGTPDKKTFTLNLLRFDCQTNPAGDRFIDFQRTYVYKQNIKEDPNISLDLIRYTKGLKVKIKNIGNEGRFRFQETGTKNIETPAPFLCGEGWTWYILAPDDHLLLPGQGYIITVVK